MSDDPFADLVPGASTPRTGYIPGVAKPEKPPSGYVGDSSGLTPIKGGPADPTRPGGELDPNKPAKDSDPKLVEAERTAAFLATRIAGGMADLAAATKQDPSADKPGILAAAAGIFGSEARNLANSPARRQVEAAQMDILDAALTLGTGAAYTKEQLEGYRESYFPKMTDDPATVASKRQRLARLLEAAKVKAGNAAPQIDEVLKALGGGQAQGGASGGPGGPGKRLTAEQEQEWQALLATRPSPDQINAKMREWGFGGVENAEAVAKAAAKGTVSPGNDYSKVDAAVQEGIDAKMAANGTAGAAGVMGAVDSVTLGFSDEIAAGGNAVVGALQGEGSVGDLYNRNIQVERGYRDQLAGDHPYANFGGQMVGGFGLPVGAAQSAGQLAKVGGAYGAAYGAGSAEGGMGDRAIGAAQGGVAGAAVGGALGKVGDIWAARKAAQGRQVPPLVDPATGRMNEPLEALRPGERVAAAEGYGIDLPMGAATDRGGAILEKGLDIMPGSAGVMNDARRVTEGQVNNAVEREAGKFGDARTMFEGGTAAQSGANNWLGRLDRVNAKTYDAIPISGKAPASVTSTTATLKDIASAFESNPDLAQTLQSPRIATYLSALEKGGLSWQDLKAFRTRIGYEIGAERFSDSPTRNDLRALYGALSEDMRNTAANTSPQALRAFERANSIYAKGQQRIDGALKQILGDDSMKNPERAAAVIQTIAKSGKGSGNLKMLAEIRASTVKDGSWDEIASALIRQGGQAVGKEGAAFNPTTFVNWYSGMTEPARNLLFGGSGAELRKSLDGFVAVNQRLSGTNALRNTSQTAPVLMGGGAVAGMATAILNPLLGLKLAAGAALNFGMGKAWVNPKFVRWATGYSKAIASKDSNAVNAQMGRLRTLGATNPQLREFVVQLEQKLLDGANDNVAQRSVAEGQDDEVNPQP